MKEEFCGKVIWFNNKAGYGFLEYKDGEDMFVHFSDIVAEGFRSLKKNQLVKYEVGTNHAGTPKAVNVRVSE